MSLRPTLWESINKNLLNAPSDPRDLPSRKHHTGDRSQPGKYLRRKIQKKIDENMPRGFKRKRPTRFNPIAKRQKFSFIRRRRRNARAVTRRLRRLGYLREELKLYQGTQASTEVAYDNTHQLVIPTGISQGDDVTNRDGRKIYLKYVYIKGQVNWKDTSATLGAQAMRVRIIWVRDTDAATFAISDVYEDAGDSTDIFSLKKAKSTQPKNFKVMYDKVWRCPGDQSETEKNVYFKKLIRVNKFSLFSGTGATEADISNGKLVVHMTSNIGVANTGPTVAYDYRVRFQDA